MIDEIIAQIQELQPPAIIAIDGRCGSGKTTLAAELQKKLPCSVIHMDDFFLRPEQRTKERLEEPGGNVDYERFLAEILQPLRLNIKISYRPYICHLQNFGNPITLSHDNVIIVEGSYSCHPKLRDFYDLHIFLDIDTEKQMKRIINRNGEEAAKKFKELWIPLEELYFNTFQVAQNCELIYKS